MKRFLSSLLLLLLPFLALAQKATDEAPTEHASMATVVVFLVLFFGGILAYVVYLWWHARQKQQTGNE